MASQGAHAGKREPGRRTVLPFFVDVPLARFAVGLLVVLVPLVLGYIGLYQDLARPPALTSYGRGWTDVLFYDLQLPVLSSAPAQGAGPYPACLQIARLLAPLVAGVATLGALWLLFTEQLRRWSAASAREHAVVAGDGPVAIELAGRLRAEQRKVVLVGTDDTTLAWARANNVLGVRGEPADPSALRAAAIGRAAELYACTSLGTVNAAVALVARDAVPAGRSWPLSAYALVRDGELGLELRARRIGAAVDPRLRLDFFDVDDIAARRLLDACPLIAADGQRASILIIGFGKTGRAVLREVARRHEPGAPPVTVLLRGADQVAVAEVADPFPAIGRGCALAVADGPALPAGGDFCTVFVCQDDADDALREGLQVARSLLRPRDQVVVCMRQSSPFAGVLATSSGLIDDAAGRLRVFGVIEEACVPANIRADYTEQLARSVHSAYIALEAGRGQTPASNPSMVPWEQLPARLRQSNIEQAADIGAKLAEIGAGVMPATDAAPPFAFTPAEVQHLAQLEHQRWLRERKADGWTYGQSRDNGAKIHPDLRDWSYLSEESREKDRNAIRALPGILGGAGFQIVRLPPL